MLFYIDESGPFAGSTTNDCAISCVGVLCISHSRADKLFSKYASCRSRLPKAANGEIKGRLLNEKQIAHIIEFVRRAGCLFEVTACDHLGDLDQATHEHLLGQVHGMRSGLTDDHSPALRSEVNALCDRLVEMPPNLYRQLVAQNDAIDRIIRRCLVYFAIRRPSELAQFVWHVDAKVDKGEGISDWEDWWQSTLGAMMQAKSIREPFATLVGGDYSFFDRHRRELPNQLRVEGRGDRGIDIRKILMDQVKFNASGTHGLELVDILTNATRRALVGNLRESGWGNLGRLIIRVVNQHRVQVIAIGRLEQLHHSRPYYPVLARIDRFGRSMFPRER